MENPSSDWRLTQMTDGAASGEASMLSYFDMCPVSADGTLLTFCSYPTRANWTAPGRHDWVGGLFRLPADPDNGAMMRICSMNLESGEQQAVAQLPVAETHNGFGLQWLPGSHTLAFAQPEFGQKRTTLHTVNADTGKQKSHELPVEGAVMCPNFMVHPQRNLALVSVITPFSKDTANTTGIWTVDLDTGEHRQLISLAAVIEATPALQGHTVEQLAQTHPKWSADGERLLFVIKDPRKPPQVKVLFSLNADGSGLRHYTSRPAHMMWHPNSRSILNNGKDADSRPAVVTIDCDSGRETIIACPHPGSGGGSHPSFSPDASQIVLERFSPLSGNGHCQLCELKRVEAATGKDYPLTRFPVVYYAYDGIHVHPQWGRDGRTLYYNSDQTGLPEVYRLEAPQ